MADFLKSKAHFLGWINNKISPLKTEIELSFTEESINLIDRTEIRKTLGLCEDVVSGHIFK